MKCLHCDFETEFNGEAIITTTYDKKALMLNPFWAEHWKTHGITDFIREAKKHALK